MDGIPQNSQIVGVGIDLAEVSRIASLLERHGETFLKKTFTQNEIAYCSKKAAPAMHFAARFAAKEAVAKALGCGIAEGVSLTGISIENDALGKPEAVLDEGARRRLEAIGAGKVLVSLTHTKEHAQAIAVAVK